MAGGGQDPWSFSNSCRIHVPGQQAAWSQTEPACAGRGAPHGVGSKSKVGGASEWSFWQHPHNALRPGGHTEPCSPLHPPHTPAPPFPLSFLFFSAFILSPDLHRAPTMRQELSRTRPLGEAGAECVLSGGCGPGRAQTQTQPLRCAWPTLGTLGNGSRRDSWAL